MSKDNKKLEIDCDDEFFMSGKVIISWKDNPLKICKINFDLQKGNTAILRLEEIEELIDKLQIVKNKLI